MNVNETAKLGRYEWEEERKGLFLATGIQFL
jgi:hypothetical protein